MKTYRVGSQIKVFQYGTPIKTDIVQQRLTQADLVNPLDISLAEDRCKLSLQLDAETAVYGLGGNLGGINKRGKVYESYCTDDPVHTEEKAALYGAHNFFLVSGRQNCGYFIDFPAKIRYDIGFSRRDILEVEIFGTDFTLYVIEGENPGEVCTRFLRLIGRAYVPPKWGFGYFQSRWGYKDKSEVLKVWQTFREKGIPLEGIFLDLDYMDSFKIFTISRERFGDFREFVARLKEQGVYLIPIVDAGVKVEKGYHVYDQGIAGNHFCLDREGKPYAAAVWPGKVHFPDFFRQETRQWFGAQYKVLTDCGIEGAWNDMNEPAIFYDEQSLADAIETATAAKQIDLDAHRFFALKDQFCTLANKERYYQNFYHQVGADRTVNSQVHNLYGYYMTKAANRGFSRLLLGKRFLLISRASSIGMHRYGGVWTGDNCSWWSHLEQNIKQMPSLNMCGFFYAGADTGGFGADCCGELLVRWLQFSVFTPLLRNHSAVGCKNQEPYAFGPEVTAMAKRLIEARYRLLPYIYSEYMKSVANYKLLFRPLSFDYADELARQTEDQLFLGDALMLAPVCQANRNGRYVYLPEPMAEVSFRREQPTLVVRGQGIHYLTYGLDELKFYLRQNTLLPYVRPCINTKALDQETVKVLAYVDGQAEYVLYDDDGISSGCDRGDSWRTVLKITRSKDDYAVEVESDNPSIKKLELTIVNSANIVTIKILKL